MFAENYSFTAGPTLNTTAAPSSLAAFCPVATRHAVLTFPQVQSQNARVRDTNAGACQYRQGPQ